MLRDSVQHDGDALRTSLDPSAIAALGSVAPALLTGDPPSGHAVSQARLFDALLRYFDGLAMDAPVLVVIEDLHWSDPGTRDAITFLVPNLVSRRVAFVLTYRTDELDRRHPLLPWLSELDRTGRFERIELQRFDRDETTSLIAAITGTEPSAAQADRIQRRADGNAFFVEELLMAGGGGLAVGGLPTTVRATLTGRVAAAPDDVQHVLRIASVGGRYVDDELLGRVADLDRESLHAALRAAVDLHLLVPEAAERGGFAFRHALVQEAVYDDLLPGERRSLHRAFAEELAAQPALAGAAGAARWAELAHHWRLAHDDVRAAEASLRAGEEPPRRCPTWRPITTTTACSIRTAFRIRSIAWA
jgi:predicted ATPase